MVLSWLDDLGLGRYVEPCSRVISCGEDLIKATAHELEKNFGIRNPLHRKKLQLALQVTLSNAYCTSRVDVPTHICDYVSRFAI